MGKQSNFGVVKTLDPGMSDTRRSPLKPMATPKRR
jgi:hypothetical protein